MHIKVPLAGIERIVQLRVEAERGLRALEDALHAFQATGHLEECYQIRRAVRELSEITTEALDVPNDEVERLVRGTLLSS